MGNLFHNRGFSLLEVMVALALLAISFTSLFLVQARATKMADQARNISIATELARYQLMECKNETQRKISSVGDFNLVGDFEEQGFPNFKWECHAPKFNMKPPSASEIDKNVKAATPDKAKQNTGAASTVTSPFISMITDALADSVRELVVIIRWTDNNIEEELRVVTHVIDLAAMTNLSRMLDQGVKNFEQTQPGKKEEKPAGEKGEKTGSNDGPDIRRGGPPPMGAPPGGAPPGAR